jgi:ribosomal protein L17
MRGNLNSRSSALMRRESVEVGIPKADAARLKLRVLATSTKSAKSARKRIVFLPVVHIRRC